MIQFMIQNVHLGWLFYACMLAVSLRTISRQLRISDGVI